MRKIWRRGFMVVAIVPTILLDGGDHRAGSLG